MTDEEIFRNWRDSADPREQVQILADLNSKKKREIASILLDQCQKHSFTAPDYLRDASGDDIGAKIEELAAKNFYCKQIADTLGISEFRVKSYCDKHGILLAKADRFGNIIWKPERGGELKSDFKLDPVAIPQKKRVVKDEPVPEPETAELEPPLFAETKVTIPPCIVDIADDFACRVQESGGTVCATAYPDGTIIVEMRMKGGESE